MKEIKFKGINDNGKTIRGLFYVPERPNRAQTIAERLSGSRLKFFMFIVKDINLKMEKCEVEGE